MSNRDDFGPKIKEILAKRVGYVCSNPNCRVSTVGPSKFDKNAVQYFGIAAHIYSASPDNGPRANPKLSSEERRNINNGIHLCSKCATLIDKNNGLDHPAEVLFKWKKQAEELALKRFYEYIPQKLWKEVLFQNLETNYSTALSCSGLNEKHVKSCPKNENVHTIIKKKLNLSKSFAILGESGCGKSLITYQIAYDYYLEGWDVFRFINENLKSFINKPIPKNENILLLIDDSQVLDTSILYSLLDLSSENVLLLFNWNISTNKDDTFLKSISKIEINSKEQVVTLKNYCLRNKLHILSKVKIFDKNVGEYLFQTSIDQKILIASKEKTPWLFNYVLTNGWHQAKYDKELLKTKNRSDIVILSVALYQIITLDRGIEELILRKSLLMFSQSEEWKNNIDKTLEDYCIKKDERIKLKHYEYARRIILNFIPENDKTVIDFFQQLCKSLIENPTYSNGRANFLELLMFDCRPVIGFLKEQKVFKKLITNYLRRNTLNAEEVYVVYSLLRADGALIKILESNSEVVSNWFQNINSFNVIGFSRLVNQLYTNKYSYNFISNTLLDLLYQNLNTSDLENTYKYSLLLERLQLYLHKSIYNNYRKKLRNLDFHEIVKNRKKDDLYFISYITRALFSIYKDASSIFLSLNLDFIAYCINDDPVEGFINTHEIMNNCFGQIAAILGGYKKNYFLYKEAKRLTNSISINEIAKKINSMSIRESDTLAHLILFFEMYNVKRITSINSFVNFEHIKNIFKNEKIIGIEHKRILLALYRVNKESKEIDSYLNYILEAYNKYPTFMLILKPDACVEKIKKKEDITVIFVNNSDYHLFGILLNEFKDYENIQNRIIGTNKKYLIDGIFSKSINVDNNRDKMILFDYLFNNHEKKVKQIFISNDVAELIKKIERLMKGKKIEKLTAALYLEMVKRFTANFVDEIKRIQNRYPKSSIYKQQSYDCYE